MTWASGRWPSTARHTCRCMNWNSRQGVRGSPGEWIASCGAVPPGGKGVSIANQSFDQQAHQNLPLQPRPGDLVVLLRHAAQLRQNLEVFEGEFDLPAATVQLQDLRR